MFRETQSREGAKATVPAEIESLATQSVNAALAVHRALGPGLLESAYEECLAIELMSLGLSVERQKSIPLVYRGRTIDAAYRLDLIVNGQLLIEAKAVESLAPVHRVQVATYLRLLHLPLGLLINFNVPLLKDGLHRVLNLDFQS
ncbi:MAG: GxxExxY protein [Candidatus Didemnitutus sp.]|nr:GxxExxY protein [Candidatus Didemnitutus sp.]